MNMECSTAGHIDSGNRESETGLSVNRLVLLGNAENQQLEKLRKVIRMKLEKKGRLAVMNAGETTQRLAKIFPPVRIVSDPLEATRDHKEPDLTHAQIINLPPWDSDDAAQAGDIISECVIAMHRAIE